AVGAQDEPQDAVRAGVLGPHIDQHFVGPNIKLHNGLILGLIQGRRGGHWQLTPCRQPLNKEGVEECRLNVGFMLTFPRSLTVAELKDQHLLRADVKLDPFPQPLLGLWPLLDYLPRMPWYSNGNS